MSYKKAIHDALAARVAGGSFTRVTRQNVASVDGVPVPTYTEQDAAFPASIECVDVAGAFDIDEKYGRSVKQMRSGWAWVVYFKFNCEVTTEEFEWAWMDSPPVIPRDPASGIDRQVRLLLERSAYEHPLSGQASQGTQVEYRILAEAR